MDMMVPSAVIGRGPRFSTSHSAALAARPAPSIEWVIEGFLSIGGINDISGPPGEGKSTIALKMVEAISRGDEFFGLKTHQLPVAWITGEASGEAAIHRDVKRLKLSEESDVTFFHGFDEALFRYDYQQRVWITTETGKEVIQTLKNMQIGLVVIDTIGSVTAGLEEINNDCQRQLARHLAKELKEFTVITISHTNQASAKDELSWRLHYLSRAGGNGFPGAIRWACGVSAIKPDDAKVLTGILTEEDISIGRYVAMGVSKHNEIPRPEWNNFEPAIFEILGNGDLVLVNGGVKLTKPKNTNNVKEKKNSTQTQDRNQEYSNDEDKWRTWR